MCFLAFGIMESTRLFFENLRISESGQRGVWYSGEVLPVLLVPSTRYQIRIKVQVREVGSQMMSSEYISHPTSYDFRSLNDTSVHATWYLVLQYEKVDFVLIRRTLGVPFKYRMPVPRHGPPIEGQRKKNLNERARSNERRHHCSLQPATFFFLLSSGNYDITYHANVCPLFKNKQ